MLLSCAVSFLLSKVMELRARDEQTQFSLIDLGLHCARAFLEVIAHAKAKILDWSVSFDQAINTTTKRSTAIKR